jgi:CBS domain-containing protein
LEPSHATIRRESAETLTVAEVMLRRPKTLSIHATVADVRLLFGHSAVRTVLLVDGEAFAGALERTDVPDDAGDDEPARAFARLDADRIGPDSLVRDAIPRLERSSEGRLVVVGDDGSTLRGLLCLRSGDDTFCVDG